MPHLPLIEPEHATGRLREIYERMQSRPLPPAYRPQHGGVAGIIWTHSLDPELMTRVFSLSANLNGQGPLSWPQREFVDALTSRLNQCFY